MTCNFYYDLASSVDNYRKKRYYMKNAENLQAVDSYFITLIKYNQVHS